MKTINTLTFEDMAEAAECREKFSCNSPLACHGKTLNSELVDPIGYNSMWGQKHWTDTTKKWTDKPYEGAKPEDGFEKAKHKS